MREQTKVSKWFIGSAVLLVVIGVVMLVWPNLTMDLLGIMIGICMLVVGLVHIIIYFTRDNMGRIMQMDLTLGVVLAAFGAFMLMHADFVSLALPFAAGIVLLIGGISKLQYALDMRRLAFRRWHLMLAAAIILIIAGLVLLYNPFADRVMIYFIGISLIIDGILTVTCVLLISHRMKKIARGADYAGHQALVVEPQPVHSGNGGPSFFGKHDKNKDEAPIPPGAQPVVETVEPFAENEAEGVQPAQTAGPEAEDPFTV